mmetsp:Transcript_39814/g.55533  ORF Transcript_39814/g.55533 Transcript_39814/m.55533 type:complete len:202 (+) Transcript_39814:844-1449(+)
MSLALVSTAFSSDLSLLLAVSRNLRQLEPRSPSRGSSFANFSSSSFTWLLSQRTISSAAPSLQPAMSALSSSKGVLVSLICCSRSSTKVNISADFISLPWRCMGLAASSTFLMASSDVAILCSASANFVLKASFISSISFSLASRAFRLFKSLAFSRAMPTWIRTRWKFAFFTPLAPSSTRTWSREFIAGSGTVKLNSFFA